MSRMDMLREIKNGTYYIDHAFLVDYCRYFSEMNAEGRQSLLGAENCQKIGEALTREWKAAINIYEDGKNNVELPNGYMIKHNQPGKLRQKYKALVPDDTPKETCILMLKEMFGIGDVVLKPPQQDKRTEWENRRAALQQQAQDVPF